MKKLALLLTLLTCHLEGILPPLHQGVRELQALLSAPELAEKLPSGDLIEQIKRTAYGYTIVTNKRTLEVHVHYTPTGKIGPADFTLEFQEPN